MVKHRNLDHEKILTAARAIACEDGFQQLTFQTLAKRLGIRSQSLYNYYDNIDGVIEAMGTDFMSALYAQLIEASTGLAGRDVLAAYAENAHAFFQSHGALVQLFYYVHHYPEKSPFVQATGKVIQLLKRLISHVHLAHMSHEAYVQALISSVLGFSVLEVMGFLPPDPDQADSYAQLVQLYLNEVVADPTPVSAV
ncbi:TetR/AcrR family transcriptional regulator [Lacticaseibacillus daqingensis]|uniref:TetR/AcrR family transcriptional regulator n=1 Tax=Lacticaseibacillus daqingensis TaxID=2486014 RepID=UPI000F77AD11|nr:TetR/AcrR family transcriptional regulator [Lacticaseibacillus daqingensis]